MVGNNPDRRIKGFHPLQSLRVQITTDQFLDFIGLDKISDKIRTPIATTDHCDFHKNLPFSKYAERIEHSAKRKPKKNKN
jgi:hypothetical protein